MLIMSHTLRALSIFFPNKKIGLRQRIIARPSKVGLALPRLFVEGPPNDKLRGQLRGPKS